VLLLPLKIAIKVVSLLITGAIAYLVLTGFQVALASRASTNAADYHQSSAIVILGSPAPGGVPGMDFVSRLTTAAALYSVHLAPKVILTGVGGSTTSPDVIVAGRSWLANNGVPASAISSVASADAVGGLKSAAASLGANARVLIITDAIDLLWTKGAATSAGLAPTVVPAKGSKVALYSEIGRFAIQTTGVAAGRIIGDLRATWAAT
jgi:uncharacterized SAM-binding protein YcdF (DUF218 family)